MNRYWVIWYEWFRAGEENSRGAEVVAYQGPHPILWKEQMDSFERVAWEEGRQRHKSVFSIRFYEEIDAVEFDALAGKCTERMEFDPAKQGKGVL